MEDHPPSWVARDGVGVGCRVKEKESEEFVLLG